MCIPFILTAKGSFAFGAPIVLGVTDVVGVLMAVELEDRDSSTLLKVKCSLFSLSPREAVALARYLSKLSFGFPKEIHFSIVDCSRQQEGLGINVLV